MEGLPTILIVDDVAMFRDLGRVLLARSGRVITARSGAESLGLLRREKPALLVADLHMPEMDGVELCRTVKADPELRHIPVVILAGNGDADDHARAVRAGADDVLTKPLSRIALIGSVNRFVRFAAVRGLPRVEVELPVRLRVDREETAGTIRNLSRGGAFVEPERPLGLEPRMEMGLEFTLPECEERLAPNAQLVWQKPAAGGLGVRFVGLDRAATGCLEDYVTDHSMQGDRMDLAVVVNS